MTLENVMKEIRKQFGEMSILKLGDEARRDVEAVSTGALGLDLALGVGGLPKGRIIELYGHESSGKTTLALHAVANVQKAGGTAAFIDAEHALDPSYAKKIGVDLAGLVVSQPSSGEEALTICEELVKSGAVDIVVVPAAICAHDHRTHAVAEEEYGKVAIVLYDPQRDVVGVLHQAFAAGFVHEAEVVGRLQRGAVAAVVVHYADVAAPGEEMHHGEITLLVLGHAVDHLENALCRNAVRFDYQKG